MAPASKWRDRDPHPEFSHLIARVRYRIETIFDQLVERFQVKKVRARDLWHLASRLIRKVLSHTHMRLINLRDGYWPSTQLERVLA